MLCCCWGRGREGQLLRQGSPGVLQRGELDERIFGGGRTAGS
jgi:hypothetical protein